MGPTVEEDGFFLGFGAGGHGFVGGGGHVELGWRSDGFRCGFCEKGKFEG